MRFYSNNVFYLETNLKDMNIDSMVSKFLACYFHKISVPVFAFGITIKLVKKNELWWI